MNKSLLIIGFVFSALILGACKGKKGGSTTKPPYGSELRRIPHPGSPEVWFAPNIGAEDTLQLFSNPEKWSTAKQKTKVFQMYFQNIYYNSSNECDSCNNVTYPNLTSVDAFRKLNSWGMELAIEAGAVKPHSCDAVASSLGVERVFQKVAQAGGVVHHISIDESLFAAYEWCSMDLEQAAQRTAWYIREIKHYHRETFPGAPELKVGIIEPFPAIKGSEIAQFSKRLTELGERPSHVHLDLDAEASGAPGTMEFNHVGTLNEQIWNAALMNIYDKITGQQGIKVGVIYTAPNKITSDSDWLTFVKQVIKTTKFWMGTPERAIFQSWHSDHKSPGNLEERREGSHTNVLIKGLELLSDPKWD